VRTLVTGFPGFIAKRLVRRLLADDPSLRVTAIVESRMADAARSSRATSGRSGWGSRTPSTPG
jgi:thioester reductase-like protein